MSISTNIKVAAAAALAVLVSGCAAPGLRSGKTYFASARVEDRPVSEPVRSVSGFTDGLACMDAMLRDRAIGPTLITSKIIPDASGQAPVAIKEMIITSLSLMSRTSRAFRYVDFEVAYSNQDTVQVLTQALLANGQMQIQPPTLYVSGAISYMDKNIIIAKRDGGIDHPDGGIGFSRDLMATQLGLELHLGDFKTRTLLPGIEAANEIALGNKGGGIDAGAKIGKVGVDFTISNEYSQGTGPATRALVDLSMIELVGKWARVPYWQCVSLDQGHPEFQRQLYEWYADMDGPERIRFLQTGLRGAGYYTGEADGLYSEVLRVALAQFQADSDAVPSGDINFETYERVAKDYVRKGGDGQFLSIGWGRSERGGWATNLAGDPRNGKPGWGKLAEPPKVDVSLGREDLVFKLGQSLQIAANVSRTSYLYCYYQDAKGAIAQIYPNPLQLDNPVRYGAPVRIPDATDGESFAIEMTTPGSESLLCLAANEDLALHWPEKLRSDALVQIPGVRSLEEIADLSERALPGRVGTRLVKWRVEGDR